MKKGKSKEVYILLTYTGTLLSKLIRLYTKIQYSHASISLDKDLTELYSFGRKVPRNPFIAGFVKEDIKEGVYSIFSDTICAVYSLEISDEQYNKLKENIEAFKFNSNNYRYNLLGIVGIPLNIKIKRKNHFFCSQFVSTVLKNSNIYLFDKPVELITLEDFIKCEKLKVVYEGYLKEYESSRLLASV
ncbi:hypothetical protein CLPU_6c01030 [Gottschalkia purinilytica]|uniref:Uncharacterized protein n=1 Tax=Gottschalkia purinilytica TaxID=1503 RepID=A0A0L0WAY2_GOTPU|nr:hypothetical protein [Gottschalkia purinilytica]KNF08617.1 hypothetical protein CLPU_6c01030 [Gottschalkia purinilytica]